MIAVHFGPESPVYPFTNADVVGGEPLFRHIAGSAWYYVNDNLAEFANWLYWMGGDAEAVERLEGKEKDDYQKSRV